MQQLKKVLQTWGKRIGIISLLLIAFFAGNVPSFSKRNNVKPGVLGVQTTPTPGTMQSPASPTQVPIVVVNNIIVPTGVPVSVSPVPTSAPIVIVVTPTPTPSLPTETPNPTPLVTISPTPSITPSPTPVPQTITVTIDYAGQHSVDTYTTPITAGETAWQAIQSAVGLANLQYTDYGGSLGIFITGFNNVSSASNQYFEFQVNGASSNVGVSSYQVADHDTLKFVLTSF